MFDKTKDIVLTDFSEKTILKGVRSIFETHWEKGVSYHIQRLQKMSNTVPNHVPPSLKRILRYIKDLKTENAFVKSREINHWEIEGAYCMFVSVLTALLLRETDKATYSKLSYYQGFYLIQTADPFVRALFGEKQTGIHAWLCLKHDVLDLTFEQHRHSLEIQHTCGGLVPMLPTDHSYALHGIKETEDTLRKYQHRFAEKQGLSSEQWLTNHVENLAKY